jgi:hypothetical protein
MKAHQTQQAVKATLLVILTALTLACGYTAKKTTPPVAGSVPTVAALSPSSMTAGGSAFTLTVNGTNFGSQAVVNWNGAARATTFVSGNQVTAAIPAADVATAGSAAVTVTNPGTPGTGGLYGSGGTLAETSSPMSFTIN